MRALVQRVTRARCTVEGRVTGAIDQGLLVTFPSGADLLPSDAVAEKELVERVFEEVLAFQESLIFALGGSDVPFVVLNASGFGQ